MCGCLCVDVCSRAWVCLVRCGVRCVVACLCACVRVCVYVQLYGRLPGRIHLYPHRTKPPPRARKTIIAARRSSRSARATPSHLHAQHLGAILVFIVGAVSQHTDASHRKCFQIILKINLLYPKPGSKDVSLALEASISVACIISFWPYHVSYA